jgi:hypothetical protein
MEVANVVVRVALLALRKCEAEVVAVGRAQFLERDAIEEETSARGAIENSDVVESLLDQSSLAPRAHDAFDGSAVRVRRVRLPGSRRRRAYAAAETSDFETTTEADDRFIHLDARAF